MSDNPLGFEKVDIKAELAKAEAEQGQPQPDATPPAPNPEPEPAQEPAVEPVEGEGAPNEPAGEEKSRTVPYGALKEERERRKQAERKYEQDMAKLNERLAAIQQAVAPAQDQAQPAPSLEDDPTAYLANEISTIKGTLEQAREEAARIAQYRQVNLALRQDEEAFRKESPDFDEAANFIGQHRRRELELMGLDQEAIGQRIQQEFSEIIKNTLPRGQSPSRTVYELAKARGYQPKSAQAPAAAPAPAAASKIDNIDRGQKAARSLSAAGGAAPQSALTPQALLEMDDDEFAQATKGKNWSKFFRRA